MGALFEALAWVALLGPAGQALGTNVGIDISGYTQVALNYLMAFLEWFLGQCFLDVFSLVLVGWSSVSSWVAANIPGYSYLSAFFTGAVVPVLVIIDWMLGDLTGGNSSIVWAALIFRWGVATANVSLLVVRWLKKTFLA